MFDVTFDESNGSQVKQVDSSVVGKEDPPCEAIKKMAIGDIRPQEDQVTDDEDPQAVAAQISVDILHQQGQHSPAEHQQGGCAAHEGGTGQHWAVPPHLLQQQFLQLLLHHLKDSTWSLSLNKKRL